MNNRTVAVGVAAAVVIVAAWWLFFFAPVRNDTTKANKDVDAAKAETRDLEVKNKQLEDLQRHAPQIKADRDRLRHAVPETPELGTFIQQLNQLAADTGVKWVSVGPQQPSAGTASGTTQLSISVEGGYFEVLDYINRLESLPRLVVVDQLSVGGGQTDGGSPGTLHASLTARMFNQAASAPAASSTDSATPTSVAGGGGVAAPPTEQGN
jgi:Tfp pilus assembly protein PilO